MPKRYPKSRLGVLLLRVMKIGNHTYYHPNLGPLLARAYSPRIECNPAAYSDFDRTGYYFVFGRLMPPTLNQRVLAELTPLKIAQDQNYLVVLENIDPQDWARPGRGRHFASGCKQQRHDGNIIFAA